MADIEIICNRVSEEAWVSIVLIEKKVAGFIKRVKVASLSTLTAFTSYGKAEIVCCECHGVEKLLDWYGYNAPALDDTEVLDAFMDGYLRGIFSTMAKKS